MNATTTILSLDFSDGMARDVSGYGHHGSVVGPTAAPVDPGRPPALRFDGVDDRVVVHPSESLTSRSGLRIGARLRPRSIPHRSVVAEGYLSFSFAVDPDGGLVGSIYSGRRWYEVHSDPGLVRVGSWAEISFAQIPPDTLVLAVDGQVVGRSHTYFETLGDISWPYGLNLGGWPDADNRMLDGDIDRFSIVAPTMHTVSLTGHS